jgi:hypothetical protein
MEQKFRLDKTVFAATNFKDANNHISYWKDKTYHERLEAAFFLINQFYGINSKTPLDRTVFSKRRR